MILKVPLSIRRRLQLIVFAALVPIGLFAGYFLHSLWQSQQAHRTDEQLIRAKTMAALVESRLESSLSRLALLAGDPRLNGRDLREFHERLSNVLAATPEWENLLLISRDSQVLNAQLPYGAPLPPSGNRAYQRETFATLRPTVSDLFQPRVRRGETVDLAIPVMREGKAPYLLLASLKRNWLGEGLVSLVPDNGGVAAVYDRTLRIVARTREPDSFIGTTANEPLFHLIREATEGVVRATSKDDVSVFVAWKVLNNGWAIATGSPTAAADREALRTAALFTTVWLSTLVIVFFLARLLWRSIDESIDTTTAIAGELAAGRATKFPETTLTELAGLAGAIEVLFARERKARASIESSSRAKDEFLAMLGHELRNPIAAISNASKVLDKCRAADPAAALANQIIGRQAGMVGRVLDDLLDLGRALTGKIHLKIEQIELGGCVHRALEALAASGFTADRQIDFDDRRVWVCGDPTRLEQIATNLITNAVKHTSTGGRIDIAVFRDGARAILRVSDNGAGIGPDALPRVFDLFYQEQRDLDRPKSGLGVGLTLVKQVALLHEGSVNAASAGIGHGATVTVSLPAIEAPSPAGQRPPAAPARRAKSILIVDDNADVLATLSLVLEMEGHKVFVAADGEAALATLRKVSVDIVLVDIGLPQMDGYAVARAIRAEFGSLHKLVALTGYGLPDDIKNAMTAGFDAHLTKPADLVRLMRLIDEDRHEPVFPARLSPAV